MFAVGTLGNYITQGVHTVAGPFHPFGGAVDIVVVQQKDGTFKSSPWYVQFGKFRGALTRQEKVVDVTVNDVPIDFHMYLDHKGEAFFEKEVQYDEETLLSLPGASSAGDEMAELGRTKRLTHPNDSTAEGLEMQEVPNRDSSTKPMNECNNPNSGMSDDVIIAPVDTASSVCVPHSSLNQPDSEVATAPPETNCSLVEEQNGTSNSNDRKLEKEESKPARSGRRLAKLSVPIFGMGFGRKSQQVSPDTSSAHGGRQIGTSLSLERAEMVADLLDRKWVTGCREILLTPSKRWQRTAAARGAGIDHSPSVDSGRLMHGSVGSGSVMNDASSEQSEFGQCSRAETFVEGSNQAIRDDSNFVETGSLMHSSEGSADVMKEASSRQPECEESSRPEIITEAFEPSIMESTAMDDLQADMMRLKTFPNREFVAEEGSFLHSAPEEKTLILVSNESSGDVCPSNDSLCKPIYEGDRNGRCHAAHTGNEQVALVGLTDEDSDRSTEGLPSPGVVLMSGDGHIIIAPADVESNQLHNNECSQQVDCSKEFPSAASCSQDVQVIASSSGDLESLESDRSKQPAVVSVSSTVRDLGVAIASELNQVRGNSGEPVRIEEVPAGPLEGEVDAGKTSEFSSRDTKITSTEMTPEFVLDAKFNASEGSKGASSQTPKMRSEHMVMPCLTAVDKSWEERDDCVPKYPAVGKFTAGKNDVDVQRDTGNNLDQSGTAADCLPGDVERDTRKLATPSDNRFLMQMEADGLTLTDADLARPNIELASGVLESPGQQVLEQFYSFKEGHIVDFMNEDSEEDPLKSCLYLEELPNCSGDDTVVAFLEVDNALFELGHNGDDIAKGVSEVDNPVFDERHNEQNLPPCKAMDSDLSEQPMEARSGTFTWVRSKSLPALQGAIKKKALLTSSASLPCRMHEAEREIHAYSRSVGSSPLYNVNPLHVKADAINSFNKDMDESVSVVDLVDMQVIKAIIYGSGKDSELIVNAAGDSKSSHIDVDLSLCRHLLSDGMGADAAAKVFASHKVTFEKFQHSGSAMFADDKLVVKIGERYFSWVEAAPYILDMGAAGSEAVHKIKGGIAVGMNGLTKDGGSQAVATVPSTTGWKLWPFSVRRSGRERGPLSAPTVPQQALLTATNLAIASPFTEEILRKHGYHKGTTKFKVPTYVPTSQQLASLRLKEGSNKVTFGFLGKTQVDARIYLWKWNTRIVVSDVDGTITRSDVLGQVMPLVGRDWTQSGVTRLFSAIKDNGYEMLFLSARAISQAYLTRQFLSNLKQDGEGLPDGPVFISPDGLIPSFYREVIRRAPHEFKITCLEGVRELFPSDVNPFYAGFGNRDTDEISYLKVGIPKGKIFLINPKGEVVVNHLVYSTSYSSLHTLVDDMFPPMSSGEQEDFNSWNFWKLPLPDIDDELNVKRAKSSKRVAGSKRAV